MTGDAFLVIAALLVIIGALFLIWVSGEDK